MHEIGWSSSTGLDCGPECTRRFATYSGKVVINLTIIIDGE